MADRSGKPRYESMKTRRVRGESPTPIMTISEAETTAVPVLLKESDIPEAGIAGSTVGKCLSFVLASLEASMWN